MREVLKKAGCTECMAPASDQVFFNPGWYCNTAGEYTAESTCILLKDASYSVPTYVMTVVKKDTKLETLPDVYATAKIFYEKDFPMLAACTKHSKMRRCKNVHV